MEFYVLQYNVPSDSPQPTFNHKSGGKSPLEESRNIFTPACKIKKCVVFNKKYVQSCTKLCLAWSCTIHQFYSNYDRESFRFSWYFSIIYKLKPPALLKYCDLFFVCSIVLGLSSHSRIFHIWRRHHYRWRAANFDLCSALMAMSSEGS